MQGVVYKELRQNLLYFLGGLLLPVIGVIMTLLTAASNNNISNMTTGEIFTYRFTMQIVGYMTLWLCSSAVFSGDESKKWSAFIAAAPHGTERHIYGKYVFLVMTCGCFFMSSVFCDSFLSWLLYVIAGKDDALNFMGIYFFMLFFQLFVFALEIPFSARFGTKTGTGLRIIVFMLMAIIFIVWLLFAPSAETVSRSVSDWLIKLSDGEIPDGLTFFMSAFPLVGIGAYLLSYNISKNCWLKGVENYDK